MLHSDLKTFTEKFIKFIPKEYHAAINELKKDKIRFKEICKGLFEGLCLMVTGKKDQQGVETIKRTIQQCKPETQKILLNGLKAYLHSRDCDFDGKYKSEIIFNRFYIKISRTTTSNLFKRIEEVLDKMMRIAPKTELEPLLVVRNNKSFTLQSISFKQIGLLIYLAIGLANAGAVRRIPYTRYDQTLLLPQPNVFARECSLLDEIHLHHRVISSVPLDLVTHYYLLETHFNSTHKMLQKRLISLLGKPNDALRFEGTDSRYQIDCAERGFPKHFECSGWEDQKLYETLIAEAEKFRSMESTFVNINASLYKDFGDFYDYLHTNLSQFKIQITTHLKNLEKTCDQFKLKSYLTDKQFRTLKNKINKIKADLENVYKNTSSTENKQKLTDSLFDFHKYFNQLAGKAADKFSKYMSQAAIILDRNKTPIKLSEKFHKENQNLIRRGNPPKRQFMIMGISHAFPQRVVEGNDFLESLKPEDHQFPLRETAERIPSAFLLPL